jgi:hypothetical protein
MPATMSPLTTIYAATGVSSTGFSISWLAATAVTGYTISYSYDVGAGPVSTTGTSATFSNLTEASNPTFTLKKIWTPNAGGIKYTSNTATTDVQLAPPAITGLGYSAYIMANNYNIIWNPVSPPINSLYTLKYVYSGTSNGSASAALTSAAGITTTTFTTASGAVMAWGYGSKTITVQAAYVLISNPTIKILGGSSQISFV